jgi:hypothetical protein
MRAVLSLLSIFLLAGPALAQGGWGYYENARFGYGLDIPPEFERQGESANGDGQIFLLDGRVARLTVWGGYFATAPDFETEARERLATDTADGWGLTAQSTTPTWATWSATRSGRVQHQHMVQLCDGTGYAALRLDYAQIDRPRIDPLVEPLIASITPLC